MSSSDDSVDMFFWLLHGTNVSSEANYIKYDDFKFQSLAMYSTPFNIGWEAELNMVMNDPCALLYGRCPYMPILNSSTHKNEVYIPPLLFGVNESDAHNNKSSQIGLYYFKIRKTGIVERDISTEELERNYVGNKNSLYTGKDTCEIVEQTKLMSYQDLKDRYGTFDQNRVVTYSILFKHILDYCKLMHFNPAQVSVGIFSCQSKHSRYIQKYDQTNTKSLIPKIKLPPSFTNTIIYDKRKHPPKTAHLKVSPAIVNFQNIKQWSALGNLKHQGCGLNVLAYYDVIPENEAREQTVCLNLNGTPIYEIVNYIHQMYNNNQSYMIIRYALNTGIDVLHDFITNYNHNFAIIFKLYETELQPNTRKYSQRGHTVSIGKLNNEVYFIDPQVRETPENISTVNSNQLAEYLKQTYNKHYIDIIYTLRAGTEFDQHRPMKTFLEFKSFVHSHHGKYISKGTSFKSPSLDSNFDPNLLPSYESTPNSKGGTRTRVTKSKRTMKTRSMKPRTTMKSRTTMKFRTTMKPRTTMKTRSIKKITETKDGQIKIFGDYFEINKEMDKAAGVTTFVKPT